MLDTRPIRAAFISVSATFNRLVARLADLSRSESGQGLTEYALILALIAVVVFVALQLVGSHVNSALSTVATTVAKTLP